MEIRMRVGSAPDPRRVPPRRPAPTGGTDEPVAPPDEKRWLKLLARYRDPDPARGVFELFVTAVPFALTWALMLACLDHGYYGLCLLLAVPAAGFLVRLFMIQHDCGHGSFFRRRRANDWVGRVIGVLTLTPYGYWRRSHAVHHATSGHLDRRGTGDIAMLTVAEYRALPRRRRLAYRLGRNPLILLGLGPIYVFFLKHRLPADLLEDGDKAAWISVMGTNLAIAGAVLGMSALVGLESLLLVQLPISLLASSIGIWLFYVQHQFEDTYWERDPDWSFHAGALHGSTHYDLPGPLRWFTANIGVHHVHHLASRIPSYRLAEVLRDHPTLREMGRLTLRQSFACFRLALWDEDKRRLVSFRELRAPAGA
ncbi:MAG TPA: fatty acid desaturase [Pilimelia sp.]|nr:fatty acid desaturase [Pilimelia sp.]